MERTLSKVALSSLKFNKPVEIMRGLLLLHTVFNNGKKLLSEDEIFIASTISLRNLALPTSNGVEIKLTFFHVRIFSIF